MSTQELKIREQNYLETLEAGFLKKQKSMFTNVALTVIAGLILNTVTAYLATTKRAEFNSARIETLESNSVHQVRFNEYVVAQQKYLELVEKNVDRNEDDVKALEKTIRDFMLDYSYGNPKKK